MTDPKDEPPMYGYGITMSGVCVDSEGKPEIVPPPLPETEYFAYDIYAFTHDQMRSYARTYAAPLVARIAELERERQERTLQYLSDDGQWIEETAKLREQIAEMEAENERLEQKLRLTAEMRDSLRTQLVEAHEALRDMLAGWKYIRSTHGDLYGVGWDRAQEKAEAALPKELQ